MNTSIVKKQYAEVIDELYDIFAAKIDQYGTDRYEGHDDQFNYWMCFSDIYRKTLRLKRLTEISLFAKDALKERNEARAKLIDDYKDIANYAIMAIQILEKTDGV